MLEQLLEYSRERQLDAGQYRERTDVRRPSCGRRRDSRKLANINILPTLTGSNINDCQCSHSLAPESTIGDSECERITTAEPSSNTSVATRHGCLCGKSNCSKANVANSKQPKNGSKKGPPSQLYEDLYENQHGSNSIQPENTSKKGPLTQFYEDLYDKQQATVADSDVERKRSSVVQIYRSFSAKKITKKKDRFLCWPFKKTNKKKLEGSAKIDDDSGSEKIGNVSDLVQSNVQLIKANREKNVSDRKGNGNGLISTVSSTSTVSARKDVTSTATMRIISRPASAETLVIKKPKKTHKRSYSILNTTKEHQTQTRGDHFNRSTRDIFFCRCADDKRSLINHKNHSRKKSESRRRDSSSHHRRRSPRNVDAHKSDPETAKTSPFRDALQRYTDEPRAKSFQAAYPQEYTADAWPSASTYGVFEDVDPVIPALHYCECHNDAGPDEAANDDNEPNPEAVTECHGEMLFQDIPKVAKSVDPFVRSSFDGSRGAGGSSPGRGSYSMGEMNQEHKINQSPSRKNKSRARSKSKRRMYHKR